MKKFKRNCPTCNKEIFYSSYFTHWHANRYNTECKSCAVKKTGYGSSKRPNINYFEGKHHSEGTKEKLRKANTGRKKTKKELILLSNAFSGSKNPMFGKTVKEVWIKKYGKKEADKREIERRKNMSKAMSGINNPMYGKPSPKGSGSGWSGWYNNWFFRSLRELSYLILIIEPSGKKWESGEKLRIKYKDENLHDRTYSPDFIVEDEIIEIKPSILHKTILNQIKVKIAIEYCKNHNMKYIITDCEILSSERIKELYDNNIIKFTDKWEKKYKERYL